jgi:uncharacterized cofD-like protein
MGQEPRPLPPTTQRTRATTLLRMRVFWRARWRNWRKWLIPGIGIKRWLLMLGGGLVVISLVVAQIIIEIYRDNRYPELINLLTLRNFPIFWRLLIGGFIGGSLLLFALNALNKSIIAPFARPGGGQVDAMQAYNRRQRGLRLVAVGGGTGLPSVLRGFKGQTDNITAIVTMADDGGSSGRLRQEMGILPPGDVRSNLAALSDDEALLTQLFQYRFDHGGLSGHSFGNLFLTALTEITGSMDAAIVEAGKVLSIRGRVLPATTQDVVLSAEVLDANGVLRQVRGESKIPEGGGRIERVFLEPQHVRAYPEALRAILNADLIVLGPGSLFTSILPSLLVDGIVQAIRVSNAPCVYICNIATQKGETDGFDLADHILTIEKHIGRGAIDVVLGNNNRPSQNAGQNTRYVDLPPQSHPVRQHYQIIEADLVDEKRPWRHDPAKLYKMLNLVVESGHRGAGNKA